MLKTIGRLFNDVMNETMEYDFRGNKLLVDMDKFVLTIEEFDNELYLTVRNYADFKLALTFNRSDDKNFGAVSYRNEEIYQFFYDADSDSIKDIVKSENEKHVILVEQLVAVLDKYSTLITGEFSNKVSIEDEDINFMDSILSM